LASIQDHGGAARQQTAVAGRDAEAIEHGIAVAGDLFRRHREFALDVVQTVHEQIYATHAGQVAGPWTAVGGRQQGAVDRHGLGRVLDAAGGAEPLLGPQGIVRIPVAAGQTPDAGRRPVGHPLQQAHAPLVGNARGDARPV
jgi:hypothetical protein